MSITFYIPCNCLKEDLINWPTFKDKLEIRNGQIDLKEEFFNDIELEDAYDDWQFCEHDQILFEKSVGQSIIELKGYLKKKYPNQFLNLISFIPEYNDSINYNYDKHELIIELDELIQIEPNETFYILNLFKDLMKKAIEVKQNVYWY